VLDQRGGLLVVGLGWLAVVAAGSLPFILTGVETDFAKAFFESTSGFTTTGATVFPAIEPLPDSILLWRSVSHWLGGMGIIVLGVAILPFLGVGGAQLFRAEAPGISTDRLTPRIASTARLLWGVYAGFTLLLGAVYVLLGMSVFDAVNHAMSTLATGGFSTRTASMAAFSPAIQWVTVLFMFVAGVNFALHYRMIAGRWTAWARDIEWQVYFLLAVGAAVVCFGSLMRTDYASLEQVIREAVFNVVAVHSTTGFATADFAAWPVLCQVILIGLMFVGAMGGSTGGGFKVVRAIVLAKHTVANFRLVIHPRAVIVHRLGGKPIGEDILLNVVGFFALYVVTHAAGTLLLAAMGYDFVTSASAAIAAMSSIGPGLGLVGPASHYGDLLPGAHLVLSALMLLGRLEFYTLLILFIPETWKLAKATR
jgi:trk system potassium uptake protein TrkH